MKVFVAGSSGVVGRWLVPQLRQQGHEVVALVRTPGKAGWLSAAGAEIVVADALDREALMAAVRKSAPEVIVHQLTALTGVADFKRLDQQFAPTNRLRTERGSPERRRWEAPMDDDLNDLSRELLVAEVKRLRSGIRRHRDSSGQELCWHHPALWSLLPEKTDPLPVVPTWPEFLKGCLRYRESLDEQLPRAPRSAEPYRP